jgi:hypothetical protein
LSPCLKCGQFASFPDEFLAAGWRSGDTHSTENVC